MDYRYTWAIQYLFLQGYQSQVLFNRSYHGDFLAGARNAAAYGLKLEEAAWEILANHR